MATTRRRFTAQFKAKVAMEALRGDRTIQAIAAKHEVHPNQVSGWKRQAQAGLQELFAGASNRRQKDHDATYMTCMPDRGADGGTRFFITRARALSRARAHADDRTGARWLSLTRQCRLLELSRSSVYYRPVGESAQTLALMRRIDELYLQYPFYGSRQRCATWRARGCGLVGTGCGG